MASSEIVEDDMEPLRKKLREVEAEIEQLRAVAE